MSLSSKIILPEVGSTNFRIVRPAVVLPQPDSPTRPMVSPAFNSNEMPSTAFTLALASWEMLYEVLNFQDCFAHP